MHCKLAHIYSRRKCAERVFSTIMCKIAELHIYVKCKLRENMHLCYLLFLPFLNEYFYLEHFLCYIFICTTEMHVIRDKIYLATQQSWIRVLYGIRIMGTIMSGVNLAKTFSSHRLRLHLRMTTLLEHSLKNWSCYKNRNFYS